jgi:ATP-dependent helicase/nuclease subunit A
LAAGVSWQHTLPDDELERIKTAHTAFAVADARSWLSPLSERVQAAWQALGGAATCVDSDARDDASALFAWLHVHAIGGQLPARHVVNILLTAERRSFSSGNASVNAVEILTIHKAKGLEWDHVFLLGIDRKQRGDSRDLAQWRFTSDEEQGVGSRSVLVVARDSRKKLEGSVYDYVSQHTSAARSAEVKRLLYVAVTRAKTTLTLTRCNASKAPATDSFSALLGDAADQQFEQAAPVAEKRLRLEKSLTRWHRLDEPDTRASTLDIQSPAYRASAENAELSTPQSQLNARAEGVVGHLLFEGLAASMGAGASAFSPNESVVKRLLLAENADEASATHTAARLTAWFSAAAHRDNVKFLFAAAHTDAASELTLVAANQDLLRADRTFVTQLGERWLVDFKFSQPSDSRALAAEAERYQPQLRQYAALLKKLDDARGLNRPMRAALYFPWLDVLHEITI